MSELALRLIAENKRTRSTLLDLGNCGLVEVPAAIEELVWLEYLSFANTWWDEDSKTWRKSENAGAENDALKNIKHLVRLANLRSLILPFTRVANLSPLAGLNDLRLLYLNTQGADLSPLTKLTALQTLSISGPRVTNMTPLSSLTRLQSLTVMCPQVTDISPLAPLTALQTLNISETQVRDLWPLVDLVGLKSLNLGSTRVSDLTPLAGLTAVQTLDISGTDVSDLSSLADMEALEILNITATQVSDLWPLANLTALQTLIANNTLVVDLSPLDSLPVLQQLDIGYTKVVDLSPLATMTALETLDIAENKVFDLWPLATLTALKTLNVDYTTVTDLSPFAGLTSLETLSITGTEAADLSPFRSLTALKRLDISFTRVTDLAALAGLTALEQLDTQENDLTDLSSLAGLTGLQDLCIRQTKVSDLSPLKRMTALERLDISGTPVADLSPLTDLTAIQTLDISSTQVTDLSPIRQLISMSSTVISTSEWRRPGIYVENCALINPPVEIVTQGKEAILNYFRERELAGVDHLYEAKMLIVGEAGAGKTSLLRRLYEPDQPLPTEKDITRGISIYRHKFSLKNGRLFHLNVWDFGGQEIYHATHQFFLTRRSLYVLVDDTRKDHKSVSDDGFKYWLELIDIFGGNSPCLIFQNEKGGRSKAIDFAGIKGKYDNVKERYAGNLEDPTAVDDLREDIEFYSSTLSHIGDQLPARWIHVREDIEQQARRTPHISQREYFEIYGKHLEFDRAKALHLSQYLHDLGVFLHFQDDPLLARTVILQNEWATEAVFQMLDDETVKAQLGRFNNADCARVWCDPKYADMHPELLTLMERFELCYLLADSKPQTWLAPQLLPPTKPNTLNNWGQPQDLVLRYHYDFMPKGIISRLTVRLHRFVRDPEMAWVTGVLFERDETMVLVEVLANGREIELRGRGIDCKALLSVVSADLDALNESFKGLRDKVDKRIPCNCKICCAAMVPAFFAQKNLLKRRQHSRLKVECPDSYEDVDVLELLDGVRADKLPAWAKIEKAPTGRHTIRIFLASSAELRQDRDAFDLYFRQQNDRLLDQGFYLEIDRWENFLDAMSGTRLQEEYNKRVRDSDIFVSLFFTKTGKFTEEEFNVAYNEFKQKGKPHIYTYFKNATIMTSSAHKDDLKSLWAFQEKLSELGHFYTTYVDIEHLKRHFRDQLDQLLSAYK